MDFYTLSATEIATGVREGKFSALDVTESCLSRIEACEPMLHAMLYVAADEARKAAARVDEKVKNGEELGAMAGVPVILKDNICTTDMPTTCASRILEGWTAPYDADVVERLRAADAVFLGKANCDEFAMGGSTENSAFGATSNPWDVSRVPGGSSGGSAAAVAAGYAPVSLGSDTGGSIRQPASFCGIYGMKPTYGAVSRYGLVAFASSLDQIGPFTRSADDMKLTMSVLNGFDKRDSTSLKQDKYDFAGASVDLKNMKIGVLSGDFRKNIAPSLAQTMDREIERLTAAGAEIHEIRLPKALKYGLACYYIIGPAEASSNLSRYDGVRYGMAHKDADSLNELYLKTRAEGFGPEVKRRILTGTYVLSSGFYDAYYMKALKVQKLIRQEFAEVFNDIDFILLPTSPSPAFKAGEKSSPLEMYMADVFTIPVNLAGLPGISYNTGFDSNNLPLGLQLIGPRGSDAALLELAAVLGKDNEGRIAEGGLR